MGVVNVVNLIPNGESVDVTDKNLMHYLETIVQYRLVTRIETPNIDNKDWMDHTRYSGIFGDRYGLHQVCKWFWEVVQDMDEERRAKLLQFVTGTSGIPAKGFIVLQGNDGELRLFEIHGVKIETCLYPRAHTCFNRFDLPIYLSKKYVEQKSIIAIHTTTGIGME